MRGGGGEGVKHTKWSLSILLGPEDDHLANMVVSGRRL